VRSSIDLERHPQGALIRTEMVIARGRASAAPRPGARPTGPPRRPAPQPQFGRNELTDEPAGAAYLIDGGIAE
jgi:hypothetical protein